MSSYAIYGDVCFHNYSEQSLNVNISGVKSVSHAEV